MAYTKKGTNSFCMPKKKNPDGDLTGMFSGVEKLTPVNRKIKKSVSFDVEVDLTENDILNWLMECKDPNALKALGSAALNFARKLETLDDET